MTAGTRLSVGAPNRGGARRRSVASRLALAILVIGCAPALHAQSQGLGGAAEAFPSGQPFDALGAAKGMQVPALRSGVGLQDSGAIFIRDVPLTSDVAARLHRALDGAMPRVPAPGLNVTNPLGARYPGAADLGAPIGAGTLSFPGMTSAPSGGRIEGASNLISVPVDAVPGMPQGLPLR